MPSIAATTTVTKQVQLKPTLKRRLLTELRTYAELKLQRDVIDQAIKGHRDSVEQLLEQTGETSLSVDGFKTTLVCPVTSRLDKKKLVEQGVTTAQIEAATITTPGRPYIKITTPSDGDNLNE